MADNPSATETLVDLLREMNGGDFIEGATRQLKALVATMKEVERNSGGKPKGKFVISIDMTLDRGVIDIGAAVKVSEPSKILGRTMRYGTEDGVLVKEDPRQHVLALGKGPVRDGTPDVR